MKERKRTLRSLPLHPPTMKEGEEANPKDLWFEREALSRSSSVSSVSAVSDMGQPSDEYPLCDEGCWLRRKEFQGHKIHEQASLHRVKKLATPVGIYSPLEDGKTRVLQIQPASRSDPIICMLKTIQ